MKPRKLNVLLKGRDVVLVDDDIFHYRLENFRRVVREESTISLVLSSDPPGVVLGSTAYGELDEIIFDSDWFQNLEPYDDCDFKEFVACLSDPHNADVDHLVTIIVAACATNDTKVNVEQA